MEAAPPRKRRRVNATYSMRSSRELDEWSFEFKMAEHTDEQHSHSAQSRISLRELEATQPRFSWKVWLIWFFGTAAIGLISVLSEDRTIASEDPASIVLVLAFMIGMGIFGATVYYGGYVAIRKWFHRNMLKRASRDLVEERAEVLQEGLEHDFFNNLVKINFKYIDRYYLQTQIQADKSFLMSAVAAFVGLLIIIAGIVLMYFGKATSASVTPAHITTATGVICEVIAALFFYLYNRTTMSMTAYHQKLVLTQNIGLALRITQDLPEKERVDAQTSLVEHLSHDINRFLVNPTDKP